MFNFFRRKKENTKPTETNTNYVPFLFVTDCFLLSKGHFGDDDSYSFEELTDNEKAILVRLFNFWHKRLNIQIQRILSDNIETDTFKNDKQKLIKTLFEICFFDYKGVTEYLKNSKLFNQNINGALLDTVKWTFHQYKLYGNNYYPLYNDLETDKINYYSDLLQNNIENLSQGDVERVYFKIIQNPCSPLRTPKFDTDLKIIRNKLQFTTNLVLGQKEFLFQLNRPFENSTINIRPKMQGSQIYKPEPKKQDKPKSSLEDFAYQLTKMAFQNGTSENTQSINAFLTSEVSISDFKILKEEIKYLMVALNQFFIYKYQAVDTKKLDLQVNSEIEKFQNQLSLGIERAFLIPHQQLTLSYDTFKDRYSKYTYYLGKFDYKDFRKSFVLTFTGQLLGDFVENSSKINVLENDLFKIGNWIYTVWTELLENALRNQEFDY